MPEHLVPPELIPGADEWLSAFWEISTDRSIGFSMGPIPSASIDRRTAHMDGEEAAMFRACIRAMDDAFRSASKDEPDVPASENSARDAFRNAMR